jgi:hypothetical protein
MRWITIGLLLVNMAWAGNSRIIPAFLEASKIYTEGNSGDLLILKPDIRAALNVLKEKNIDPLLLEKYTHSKSTVWPLRKDDVFDGWTKEKQNLTHREIPEIAVHAIKIKVVEESDDWLKDDIYAYYFITDGVIPTGKVTSIYKGLGQGQSFFFNEIDRAIFPLIGVPAKKPDNHLIIDYGIVESDGDDIKDLQKLSSIIIDLAIAVYTSYDPQNAQILINLRKEVKALAELLLSMNNDDRLVTGTIAWKVKQLEDMLKDETYVEVTRRHHSAAEFKNFDYRMTFRILRK